MRARIFLLLVASLTGAVATSAHADDTFATRAEGATRVTGFDDLVWSLTAACDKGDDVQQRQCRHTRDTRVGELASGLLLVDADVDALTIGAWNPAKKSVAVTLAACIRCGGVKVDGRRWLVVGNKPATVGADGIAHGDALYDNAKTFVDAAAAKRWSDSVAHVRVQLLVRAPAKAAAWHVGTTDGVTLDVVGYLVANPCNGSVVLASPPLERAAVDKAACAAQTPVSVPK